MPIHTDIEFSKQVIKDVFSTDGIYAIVPKGQEEPIGYIGLLIGEAMRELMSYSFNDLGLESLWRGYFEGNSYLYQQRSMVKSSILW